MVNNIKDLEKLLKLLRKQGVVEFKHGEIQLRLGDLPQEASKENVAPDATDPANPYSNFPDGILTPEQLMFYSSGGDPSEDPENQVAS